MKSSLVGGGWYDDEMRYLVSVAQWNKLERKTTLDADMRIHVLRNPLP